MRLLQKFMGPLIPFAWRAILHLQTCLYCQLFTRLLGAQTVALRIHRFTITDPLPFLRMQLQIEAISVNRHTSGSSLLLTVRHRFTGFPRSPQRTQFLEELVGNCRKES
ncbi:hypothetical protein KQH52_07435 [Mycetohabitans sp. B7]|uniref:hypothetical protein n=1 Tax=Mycetohabitans sp. B7 TaxID=2841844 RepID=UPI001F2A211A|nr:hypothetical protein [Mycetohabitans sp. B7]MCG1039412.1 hypothetical protein [Mycetohabitans sp. B7]